MLHLARQRLTASRAFRLPVGDSSERSGHTRQPSSGADEPAPKRTKPDSGHALGDAGADSVSAAAPAATHNKRAARRLWKPIVWIDCEMTGLDVAKDRIIEICCIITDGNLRVVDPEGYESTVHVPKEVLDNMGEWCVEQHGKSGLTARVLANPQQTLDKVQNELLEYVQKYVPEPLQALLAGNSVHMDKFFMMKEFPRVVEHLHYRLIDVLSIMEVGYRHNPELMRAFPKKKGSHTAKSDIMESMAQLQWYRDNYLKSEKECAETIKASKEAAKEKEAREKEMSEAGEAKNAKGA